MVAFTGFGSGQEATGQTTRQPACHWGGGGEETECAIAIARPCRSIVRVEYIVYVSPFGLLNAKVPPTAFLKRDSAQRQLSPDFVIHEAKGDDCHCARHSPTPPLQPHDSSALQHCNTAANSLLGQAAGVN